VTMVDAEVEGDRFFPEIDFQQWREVRSESFSADTTNRYAFSTVVFDRLDPPG